MNRNTLFYRLYREKGESRVKRLGRKTWVYPAAAERTYAKALGKFMLAETMDSIEEAVRYYEGTRADSISLGTGSQPSAGALLAIAKDVDKFNKGQWSMFQEIAIGDAWDEAEDWVGPTLKRWAKDQVTLIKNSQGVIQQSVERRVKDAVRRGSTVKELKERLLRDLPGMSQRRAELISRDQVAKLNGELTRGRMEDAGLETYIWETAMDERVRGAPAEGVGGLYPDAVPAHTIMQGKVCRWDNPSVYLKDGEWVSRPPTAPTNHPGMEIQCRCVALPNWKELEDPALGGQEEPPGQETGEGPSEPQPSQETAVPVQPKLSPEETPDEYGVTPNRIKDLAAQLVDRMKSLRLLDQAGAYIMETEIAKGIRSLPPSWRAAWVETAEAVPVRTKKGTSCYEIINDRVVLSKASKATTFHEFGHAAMARLGSASWLDDLYKKMETFSGTSRMMIPDLKKYGGSNFKDRALQVNLGKSIHDEFLEAFSKINDPGTGSLFGPLHKYLEERGLKYDALIADNVSDWLSLVGYPYMTASHPPSYRAAFRKLAEGAGLSMEQSRYAALSVEAGAEFFALASSSAGLEFLRTCLPKSMELFEKEIIGR